MRGDIFRATRADANGVYSIEGMPVDTYDVTASGGGCYEPATIERMFLGRSRTLDFTLAGESDEFGNTCRLEAAAFEEAGTVVPLTGDDEVATVDLPFAFTFYGFPYRRAHICTNGFIELVGQAASNCSASNAAIPTTGRPNSAIYPFWDDMNIDAQSSIRTETKGSAPNRRFVIEFRNVQFFEDTTGRRVDFNTVLHENGQIQTQYRNIANDGRETGNQATIGIEDHTGRDALRFSFNEVALGTEPNVTSLRYTPPPLPPSQAVSGRVVDQEGRPIANASVMIEDTPITPATTDANGVYSFERIPEGTYEATASATGCNTTETKELVVSGPTTLDFALAERSDAFGHTCALEAAAFEEADTVLPISGDATAGTVDLPFPFTFYGFTYTRAYVCTNGFVEFVGPATSNCSSTNAAIPTTGRPNGAISPFWDNLNVDEQSSIRADVRGAAPDRRFVIEFRDVLLPPSTSARVDFNVVLHEGGEIVTQYRNIADVAVERGSSATIGIENHSGNDALRVSFNQPVLAAAPAVTSIRYTAPPQPPSHTVSGHVRGPDDRPLANATVTIQGTPITPATTDANGFYSFARVPEGSYTVSAASACNGPRNEELEVSGPTTLDFTVPPRSDAFGYTCAPEAAAFEQADTVLPITGDDEAGTIDLPFPFTFYGQTYTRAHVCTNGFIEFVGAETTNCSATNGAIPTSARPNGAIYSYWDDTFVDAEASIRADVTGSAPNRRFVIEFRNLHYFNDTTGRRVDFNIVLFENGEILTQSRNLSSDGRERGNSATIGIESHTGTDALRFSFNQAVLDTEPAVNSIRYRPPPPAP
jgi:protocatechuate 3,4-dioxygenase beta subunit